MLFRAIIGTGKKNFLKQFLQSFRAQKMFYAIIAKRLGFQHLPRGPADVNA